MKEGECGKGGGDGKTDNKLVTREDGRGEENED